MAGARVAMASPEYPLHLGATHTRSGSANSQELAERAATMTPEQYQADQSQLYAIACSIVAGEDCLADK